MWWKILRIFLIDTNNNKRVKQKIILLGGGGHAKVLIGLIRTTGIYEIVGILDLQLNVDVKILGVHVLGKDGLLPQLYGNGITNACIGIGSVKDNSRRKNLYEEVKNIGFNIPSLIHQNSIISEYVQISDGVQIMAGAIIQTGATIGENTIVNTGAIIEHDCNIGAHVHICPGAVVSGGCTVGESAFIGTGATIRHEVEIGKNATVAAGAVVINNVPEGAIVKGVPAR